MFCLTQKWALTRQNLSGIFFGCLRGRYKAPVPMANAFIFSQFEQKNPNQKVIFM